MGKIATKVLASGDGWKIADVVCTAGPQDQPFEEQHNSAVIAVVMEGSFQYRSTAGSEIMSPGSMLLNNCQQDFECRHEHGTGDRCVSFHYSPDFFDRAGAEAGFPIHRIPAISALAPWVVQAHLATRAPATMGSEELAYGLADAVLNILGKSEPMDGAPTMADERRISAALRFIEANLGEHLSLDRLAATSKMSKFHFLRVFKRVVRLTPHQYILRARLRKAALRLKTNPDSVLDIALYAGFCDLSNFNHAFRAEFGVSPTIYTS